MSALEQVFARCREEGRAALVAYLPAGYPDLETSVAAVRAVAEAGADVVEVGVPYTDPLMDGPVIEQAASQALAAGFRLSQVFEVVRAVAEAGAVPVVMSYWNPVLRYGPDRFARDLAAAGGAGLITPDLVPDEAGAWLAAADAHGVDPVFLVAPSSTDERLRMTTEHCRGFVYVASTMGVTGARSEVGSSAEGLVARTRAVTDLPLCVGLGVSTGEQAAQVAAFADGVIVGSALVRTVGEDPGLDRLRELTAELARGVVNPAAAPPAGAGA
ncbi:tryptophan synthase subunit alpha [Ornithinimicrobium humiphilum]|uniref:Tryptophan synthase alpha chain n=1 Tax=Ornithinimicrobium humiphilum TaxID=125288 RepID=A0A543KPK0_9MICO|nr:tryptophan synthase subunit alpha [Ornithinimicrobium humiphilum]TQM96998.1 tryptophan synthase alpha chain [Ornithinimicrobium humiphilum]